MSLDGSVDRLGPVTGRLEPIVRGRDDRRVRATYRVLLAMPVFWILSGGVIDGQTQSAIERIPSGGEPLGIHAWIQQLVFFRIVGKNAADGLSVFQVQTSVPAPVGVLNA